MEVEKYLSGLRNQLLEKTSRKSIVFTREWINQVPNEAGVYVLFENDSPVYAGETGNLRGRMEDMTDSRRHTVRRTIGERFFATTEGFVKATVKLKFPDHIEIMVTDKICNNLKIAWLAVPLGRKELEESVASNIPKEFKLNKRGKRV